MAFTLYAVGIVVAVSGLGWLLTWLGVGPTIVNPLAFALLAAGIGAGIARLRLADRA